MGAEKRRKPRIVALSGALAVAALIATVGPVLATKGSSDRLSSARVEPKVLDQLAANGKASFVIYLKDQADLSKAYGMKDQDARGWYVYRTLKNEAARTQAPLRAMLDARGVSYRSFWVANVIMTSGDRALVDDLAARSDVTKIEASTKSNWLQGEARMAAKDSPGTIEPGINQVHAPQMWALEATNRAQLEKMGVTRESIKAGELVKARCHPLRDKSNGCLLGFLKTGDGSVKDWDGGNAPAPKDF